MDAIFQFLRRRNVRKSLPTAISMNHTLEGHQDYVWSFVFLQDNTHIVSGSNDGMMRKWDCETGQLVGEPWEGKDWVMVMALSPDGKTIACGRSDGRVERWDTNGQMKEDIWTGGSGWVRSLSWSPNGGHLASGSSDGTILVRNVESGVVEVGPIKTNHGILESVAYSPLGDRIASGGMNTICIWDSHTGELLVGPFTVFGGGGGVHSIVWSSDGSKLYSARSDEFARVFDSTSGTLLHRLQHDRSLTSIALSPKHNLLACVGMNGTAQLWDTESHKPFHVPGPFVNKTTRDVLRHVAFSPDGRYLAYGGDDKKITLWTVGDERYEPSVPASSANLQGGMQQDILPKSQSSSSLNVDDTNLLAQSAVNDEQGPNDPYNTFFASSHSSLPSPSPNPSPRRRFRHVLSVLHLPTNEHMRHKHFTHRIFQRRAPSTSPSRPPANCEQPQPTLKGMSRAVNQHEEHGNVNSSENVAPATAARIQASSPNIRLSPAELSRPPAAHTPSHRSKRARPRTTRRVWAMINPSRHHPPCTEPEPVTIYAARPKKLYWRAPRRANKQAIANADANADANTNANTDTDANANTDANASTGASKIAHTQTIQSPSVRGQLSAVQPGSGPYTVQSSQTQLTHGQHDFGCWGNFCLSLWCIPRPVSSVALPRAS